MKRQTDNIVLLVLQSLVVRLVMPFVMPSPQREQTSLRERFRAEYTGVANAGKVMVMENVRGSRLAEAFMEIHASDPAAHQQAKAEG